MDAVLTFIVGYIFGKYNLLSKAWNWIKSKFDNNLPASPAV